MPPPAASHWRPSQGHTFDDGVACMLPAQLRQPRTITRQGRGQRMPQQLPQCPDLFAGFASVQLQTSLGPLFARIGGSGPPLLPSFMDDPLGLWQPWCEQPVRGGPVRAGHFLAEVNPGDTLGQMLPFLREG